MKIVPADKIPKARATPTGDMKQVFETCVQMEKLCRLEGGVGLAAVQVGIPWKLFVVQFPGVLKPEFRYFMNCQYAPTEHAVKIQSEEGCLSLKGRLYSVPRFDSVAIKGHRLSQSADGYKLDSVDMVVRDFLAIKIQHEIDHCYDILISQIGKEIVKGGS